MVKKVLVLATLLLFAGLIGGAFTIKGKLDQNDFIEKNVEMTDVEQVEIVTTNGKVSLYPTNEEEATIKYTGNLSDYELVEKLEDNTLSIMVKSKGLRFFSIDLLSFSQSIDVAIPERLYDSITVNTNNGRIDVEHLQINHLDAKTDNGRISVSNVMTETSNVRSSNGKISLDDVVGEINAHTSNGKIYLETESLDQPIDLSTSNGAIEIVTENRPTNAVIDAKTDNGKIEVYGDRKWDIITGNGDNVVKLTTDNGRITITDK